MKFQALDEEIPHAIGKKLHTVSMSPYQGVQLRMPGRHQKDTPKRGGDFVVIVTDKQAGWANHRFKHDDLFVDIESKRNISQELTTGFMQDYAAVVCGEDPTIFEYEDGAFAGTVSPKIMLCAAQCLAVAEHRRYARFESKGGGRFLPVRMAFGIAEGLWTAADAAAVQKRGRPGLEHLINTHGQPVLDESLDMTGAVV